MKALGMVTMAEAGTALEWTVFRVPFLTNEPDRGVYAGELNDRYPWTGTLSREGQAKWLLKEIEERRFVAKLPELNDLR